MRFISDDALVSVLAVSFCIWESTRFSLSSIVISVRCDLFGGAPSVSSAGLLFPSVFGVVGVGKESLDCLIVLFGVDVPSFGGDLSVVGILERIIRVVCRSQW